MERLPKFYMQPNRPAPRHRVAATVMAMFACISLGSAAKASTTISLDVQPPVVTYGSSARLSGTVRSGGLARLWIDTRACRAHSSTIITPATTRGRSFTSRIRPDRNTTYVVHSQTRASLRVRVRVRPLITVRRMGDGQFEALVLAGVGFSGKRLEVEIAPSQASWRLLKLVVLSAASPRNEPLSRTAVATTRFRAPISTGMRLRVTLSQAQAGPCYAPSSSRPVVG
jgi:hypothetical protein